MQKSYGDTDPIPYEYDFGDGWEHDIRLLQRLTIPSPGTAFLTGGERACPPDDCGGPGGYAQLLAILDDPSHPEHARRVDWLGQPFDAEALDVDERSRMVATFERWTRQRETRDV